MSAFKAGMSNGHSLLTNTNFGMLILISGFPSNEKPTANTRPSSFFLWLSFSSASNFRMVAHSWTPLFVSKQEIQSGSLLLKKRIDLCQDIPALQLLAASRLLTRGSSFSPLTIQSGPHCPAPCLGICLVARNRAWIV